MKPCLAHDVAASPPPHADHRPAESSRATDETALDALVHQIVDISALPAVALRAIEVAQDPGSGAADLKRVVEGDPALSARLLRMVNSAAFGVRTRVTNLHQAISFAGFSQIRNLALTASVSELFSDEDRIGLYSRAGLWRHLVSVAVASRMVAVRTGMRDFEDAFVAGLLHDIGIILIDQHAHARFTRVIRGLDGARRLCDAEHDVFGFDHTTLGARIAEKWRFPPGVTAAIRHHHASHDHNGPDAPVVHCVAVANTICTMKGIPSVGLRLVAPPVAAFQALHMTREDVLVLAIDLDNELKLNEALFEL